MENEEILLQSTSNPVNDVDRVSFERATQVLVQEKKLMRCKQTLTIHDDKYLKIEQLDGNKKRSYYLHLMFLGTEGVYEITTKWIYWHVAMFLMALFSGLFYAYDHMITSIEPAYLLAGSLFSLAGGVVMVIMLFYTHRSIVIYSTSNGVIPVLRMLYENPSVSDFLIFAHYMKLCATQSREKGQYSKIERLAMELKEHRRLRDEKIISNEFFMKQLKKRLWLK